MALTGPVEDNGNEVLRKVAEPVFNPGTRKDIAYKFLVAFVDGDGNTVVANIPFQEYVLKTGAPPSFQVTTDDAPIPADNVSAGASFNTVAIDGRAFNLTGIQLIWDSLDQLDATCSLEASADDTNYDPVTGQFKNLNTASGTFVYQIPRLFCRYLRLSYSAGSVSSGTLKAYAILKAI